MEDLLLYDVAAASAKEEVEVVAAKKRKEEEAEALRKRLAVSRRSVIRKRSGAVEHTYQHQH